MVPEEVEMTAIPRLSGVLETLLYVEDFDRSRAFY